MGCGPRGISSGSTARVTPLAEARLRAAERSPWSWVALVEVQGITVLTCLDDTAAPEIYTHDERVRVGDESVQFSSFGFLDRVPHLC